MEGFGSYEKQRRYDKQGQRWHFVKRYLLGDDAEPDEEQAYELYFRNDDRTEFGLLRFEHRRDNPYRDHAMIVNKIMNDVEFRRTLLDAETEEVWLNSWK